MPSVNRGKVSCIIPVFNTGKSAVKLILSIARQDYKDIEFVVVDDGSTDGSLKLLKEFARQYKLKYKKELEMKILAQENQGASSARNLGLRKATGEYVCFIDSDDMVEPGYVKRLVAELEKYDDYNSTELRIALASSAVHYVREVENFARDLYTDEPSPQMPGESYAEYVLRLIAKDGRLYAVNNKIFRRNIIENYGILFDEKLNFAEDTKFVLDYLKAARKAKYSKLAFVTEPLYIYHFGTETSVVSMSALSWSNWQKSFDNLWEWCGVKGKVVSPAEKKVEKLLRKVYFRWKISHALAVARSKQSLGHKFQHASPLLVLPALIVVRFRK